eukprot:46545-Pelagomonas_calceolata.AAC.2
MQDWKKGLYTFFKPPHSSLRSSGRRSRKQREKSPRKCLRNSVQKQPSPSRKSRSASASLGAHTSQQFLLPMHALKYAGMMGTAAGKRGPFAPAGMCIIQQTNYSKECGITAGFKN